MINLSIRYKLLLSFIGIALLSVPLNIYMMANLSKVTESFAYFTEYQQPRLQALLEMKNTALRINLFISNFNYSIEQIKGNESTPTQLGATKDQLLAYLQDIADWQKIYQQHLLPSEPSRIGIKQLTQLRNDVIIKALDVFSAKEENLEKSELIKRINALERAQAALEHFINTQLSTEAQSLENTKEKNSEAWRLLSVIGVVASALLLFIACLIGFILSRWIATPIISLRNFAYKIKQDNLNLRVPILSKDEIGELSISINKMLENLSQARGQIIEASRLAGVAEVATNVIHNVGNILNSVNTSVSLLIRANNQSKISILSKLYDLINNNKNNLDEFLNNDERGKLILPYFQQVIQALEKERMEMRQELDWLDENLAQIEQVVTMQLSSEITQGVIEPLNISELIEGALCLQDAAIKKNNINIERNYLEVTDFYSVKSKLQQVLVNLIKNAVEALIVSNNQKKNLVININKLESDLLRVSIQDNGTGILKENLDRIFSFGFTTKPDGHGYGLHSCALLASELGGVLCVESAGLQQGSTFNLDIPNLKSNV